MVTFGIFPTLEKIGTLLWIVGSIYRQTGTAGSAYQDSGKPVLAGGYLPPFYWPKFLCQAGKISLEKVRDTRPDLMSSLKLDAVPFHNPHIEVVSQDPVDGPALKGVASFCAISPSVTFSGNSGHIMAFMIIAEDKFYHGVFLFVDNIRFSAANRFITQAWRKLVAIAKGFFGHAS